MIEGPMVFCALFSSSLSIFLKESPSFAEALQLCLSPPKVEPAQIVVCSCLFQHAFLRGGEGIYFCRFRGQVFPEGVSQQFVRAVQNFRLRNQVDIFGIDLFHADGI